MSSALNVFVTGASSGIGRAAALELAARGHQVFAAARREALLDELAAANPRIQSVPLDVTDRDSIAAAAKAVRETAPQGLDVLVNAAGYALIGPVGSLPRESVQTQFATNVFGLLEVTQAFLPDMRERGRGSVINVSSIVGRFAMPGMGAYSASKFALEALSDCLRIELAPFGVSVVLIEPAFVATQLAQTSARQGGAVDTDGDTYEGLVSRTQAYVGRQLESNSISPERVAKLIATVAESETPKARYLIPLKAKLLVRFLNSLPVRAADRGKRRTLGWSV